MKYEKIDTTEIYKKELAKQGYAEYEVWIEGYEMQGNKSGARRSGSVVARTFDEAVNRLVAGAYQVDVKWMVFGCQLFDNEKDARKAFG